MTLLRESIWPAFLMAYEEADTRIYTYDKRVNLRGFAFMRKFHIANFKELDINFYRITGFRKVCNW